MPLVRIDASSVHDDETLAAFGDVVHQALVDALGIPQDDFFQVITRHEPHELRYDPAYLGVSRDDGIVFVGITMRAGRLYEQKKALYARIAELAEERTSVEPRNVFVTITENQQVDWSFGEGVAQYLH
ncbi:tautomerase family protein [Amycolatopsis dongchuanensis]|uniref:Tautomerase family protein n=1 Tax=Amycolatopsis dongchuanensis TaxID=1070866 RepID=A0ABP9QM52_9PSEU